MTRLSPMHHQLLDVLQDGERHNLRQLAQSVDRSVGSVRLAMQHIAKSRDLGWADDEHGPAWWWWDNAAADWRALGLASKAERPEPATTHTPAPVEQVKATPAPPPETKPAPAPTKPPTTDKPVKLPKLGSKRRKVYDEVAVTDTAVVPSMIASVDSTDAAKVLAGLVQSGLLQRRDLPNDWPGPSRYCYADADEQLAKDPPRPEPPVDADEVERLRAEVERLEAEAVERGKLAEQYHEQVADLRLQLHAAKVDVKAKADELDAAYDRHRVLVMRLVNALDLQGVPADAELVEVVAKIRKMASERVPVVDPTHPDPFTRDGLFAIQSALVELSDCLGHPDDLDPVIDLTRRLGAWARQAKVPA